MAQAAKKQNASKQNRKPAPAELRAMPDRINKILARLKAEQGLSLSAVARRGGLDRSQLSETANGNKLDGITAAVVLRIAKGLQVDVGWLLTGDETKSGGTTVIVITPDDPRFAELGDAAQVEVQKALKRSRDKLERSGDGE